MISLANISLYLSPQTPPSMGLSHHTTAFVLVGGQIPLPSKGMGELSRAIPLPAWFVSGFGERASFPRPAPSRGKSAAPRSHRSGLRSVAQEMTVDLN